MGAGKTAIGKRMANHLGRQFVDMDLFIENRYRKTVSEIFADKGEVFFREIERNILQEIAPFENTVISTGGGVPCFFDNMDLMNRTGTTVYLKVSVNELVRRLIACKQDRPLIKDKSREELKRYIAANLDKREIWYNRAAIIFPAENMRTQESVDAMIADLIQRINEKET